MAYVLVRNLSYIHHKFNNYGSYFIIVFGNLLAFCRQKPYLDLLVLSFICLDPNKYLLLCLSNPSFNRFFSSSVNLICLLISFTTFLEIVCSEAIIFKPREGKNTVPGLGESLNMGQRGKDNYS